MASAWDEQLSLGIEADLMQGVYVLLTEIGPDRQPLPGPYVAPDRELVRIHAGVALERTSQTGLASRLRSFLADWPFPNLEQGDFDALSDVRGLVWASAHEISPFGGSPDPHSSTQR